MKNSPSKVSAFILAGGIALAPGISNAGIINGFETESQINNITTTVTGSATIILDGGSLSVRYRGVDATIYTAPSATFSGTQNLGDTTADLVLDINGDGIPDYSVDFSSYNSTKVEGDNQLYGLQLITNTGATINGQYDLSGGNGQGTARFSGILPYESLVNQENQVPLPGTLGLLGVAGVAALSRRRKSKS